MNAEIMGHVQDTPRVQKISAEIGRNIAGCSARWRSHRHIKGEVETVKYIVEVWDTNFEMWRGFFELTAEDLEIY